MCWFVIREAHALTRMLQKHSKAVLGYMIGFVHIGGNCLNDSPKRLDVSLEK